MSKYAKHFCTVVKHKYEVGKVCFKFGLYWQGIAHDMSKFSPVEFFPSARYFQGDKSPIEAEKAARGYSKAWLHHKAHNKHHPYYWIDWDSHEYAKPCRIPAKYVYEMIADWIGAGKVYDRQSGKKWNCGEPLRYWNKYTRGNKDTSLQVWHPQTRRMIGAILRDLKEYGIEHIAVCIQTGLYEYTYYK